MGSAATLASVALACACTLAFRLRLTLPVPVVLEPMPGVSQCGYELLRAFACYAAVRLPGLRYMLGAGTLLGAMRKLAARPAAVGV